MRNFRFENLIIWQSSIKISNELFDIADIANDKKFYRFSEQLRGAALSISNNIAEGSGSFSDRDFANFLNISRRSVFECANLMHIFEMRNFINKEKKIDLLSKLDILSSQITNFRKKLL